MNNKKCLLHLYVFRLDNILHCISSANIHFAGYYITDARYLCSLEWWIKNNFSYFAHHSSRTSKYRKFKSILISIEILFRNTSLIAVVELRRAQIQMIDYIWWELDTYIHKELKSQIWKFIGSMCTHFASLVQSSNCLLCLRWMP